LPGPTEKGLSFVETYPESVDEYDFDPKAAHNIVLRACRGRGLTNLQVLVEAVDYVAGGGTLDVASVGNLAADDLPGVRACSCARFAHTAALNRLLGRFRRQVPSGETPHQTQLS
jgi:hypothetical protein